MTITEENLTEQIKKRNEKAITFIIQRYGGLLSAIIKRHVQFNQQEYEECLDDVLLAVWYNIDAFDGRKNTFKQWIAAIAKYRAIDYQRRLIRTTQITSNTEYNDAFHSNPHTQAQHELTDILAGLSAADRELFEQYYLQGVPSRELAQQLNVQESWIHNKLSCGRKKLKQLFISKSEV
ncbi:sigma-70 family RNA polymerase sigma factor [Paenibacillus tianjinensis]|uniref:Sigma-70 family RNA polymerase sigma factor n=1 Tax=Paenibacillus tianjinensis TaxID=2810347 RepID=A0ABX7L878_9BACL|nr:sigma-70 family RNA polymerase sigma factor [Paenibacillus tianjinensis]QSF44378.1 sigma-70 family RNA polymerase sigma factor [Paenibacillus tianjinensis]